MLVIAFYGKKALIRCTPHTAVLALAGEVRAQINVVFKMNAVTTYSI